MKMLRRTLVASIAMAMVSLSGNATAQTTLNVISGGSQNMVDYVTDYLGPLFEKQNPGVKVSVVGTGPDDAGSQMACCSNTATAFPPESTLSASRQKWHWVSTSMGM